METMRIMFVGKGAGLLPEDRVVNTFHFHSPTGSFGDHSAAAMAGVADFYNGVAAGGKSIAACLSPWVQRAAELRLYDMTLAPHAREPTINALTLAAVSGGGMPEEIALVLTLKGDPPDTPRRRGRLYIGPLNRSLNVEVEASAALPNRPKLGVGGLVQAMEEGAERLRATMEAAGCPWCIRSVTPSENYVEIRGGHIDNAWDTVRRRGPETTTRTIWGELA